MPFPGNIPYAEGVLRVGCGHGSDAFRSLKLNAVGCGDVHGVFRPTLVSCLALRASGCPAQWYTRSLFDPALRIASFAVLATR